MRIRENVTHATLIGGFALLLIASIAGDANALVVGGFEGGSLTNWFASPGTLAGVTSSHQPFGGGAPWLPTEGSAFGYIRPMFVSPASGRFSLISDVFALSTPGDLNLDLFVDPANEVGSTRRAMVHLLDGDLTTGSGSDALIYSRRYDAPGPLDGGWTHLEYHIAHAGSYRVEFAVSGDEIGIPYTWDPQSLMGFDDVQVNPDVEPVPEPGTLALLAGGLLALGFVVARTRG